MGRGGAGAGKGAARPAPYPTPTMALRAALSAPPAGSGQWLRQLLPARSGALSPAHPLGPAPAELRARGWSRPRVTRAPSRLTRPPPPRRSPADPELGVAPAPRPLFVHG